MNMVDLRQLKPQYVTNEAGEKTAIILPLEVFEELLEDIEDLAIVAERREEPTMAHDQLVTELKRDGLIEHRVEALCGSGTEKAPAGSRITHLASS
jgi:hypothetical protein